MIIGILKEPAFENRVSLIPEAAKNLIKLKAHILVETNAGAKAMADDAEYVEAGAKIASREELMKQADILLSIQTPEKDFLSKLGKGKIDADAALFVYGREDHGLSDELLIILDENLKAHGA